MTLKKPNYRIQLLGVVFMIIGPIFISAGYMNRIGLLPTAPNSQGDPASSFPIIGMIFFIAGAILFFIPLYKEKSVKS